MYFFNNIHGTVVNVKRLNIFSVNITVRRKVYIKNHVCAHNNKRKKKKPLIIY